MLAWFRTVKLWFRKLKLRYKLLLGFLVAWFYLFLIGYILLRSPDFRGYLQARLIVELEKNLNAKVAIGEISGNVFSWVRLRDVRVVGPRDSGTPAQARLLGTADTGPQNQFSADLVTVRFSLWEGLRGNLWFSNLQLTKPRIVLYTETLSKAEPPEPMRRKSEAKLNLRWIQIVHATVELHHQNQTYELSNVNFAGSLNYDGEASRLQIGIRKCSGSFAESGSTVASAIAIDELRGYLQIDNKRIEVRNLLITGNDIHLQADGSIIGYQFYDPFVNIQISSTKIPLQKLLTVFPLATRFPLSGTAKGTLVLSGQWNNLTGTGELQVPGGKYRDIPFTAFQTSFSATTGKIKLEKGKLTMFGGQIAANGELILQSEVRSPKSEDLGLKTQDLGLHFTVALKAENLMLDKFLITQAQPATPLLTGKVNGVLQLSGNLDDRDTWFGSARIHWVDGTYKNVSITTAELAISLEKGTVNIQTLVAENNDIQAEGAGFIRLKNSETKLQVRVTASRMDSLNRLLNWSGLSGRGSAEIILDGTLRTPRISGNFMLADGALATIKFGLLRGQLTPENEFQLHLEQFQWGEGWNLNGDAKLKLLPQNRAQLVTATLRSGASQLTGSGEIDFAHKRTQLTFSGKGINLADFSPIQKALPQITAQVDVDGTIEGPFNGLVMRGNLSAHSVSTNPVFRGSPTLSGQASKFTPNSSEHPISSGLREQQSLPNFAGTVTYTAAQKQIQVALSGAGYFLQGSVLFAGGEPNIQLHIMAQSGDMKLLAAGLRIANGFESGTINGTGTISGKGTNLTVSGNVRQFEILMPDSANKIILTNGTYSGKIAGKSGEFQVSVGALKMFNGRGRVSLPNLNGRGNLAPTVLLASLESISGDLFWNEPARVECSLNAARGIFSSVPFTGLVTRMNYQAGFLTITDSSLVTGGGTISLSGSVNGNLKPFIYQVTAKAQNVQLQPVLLSIPGIERFSDSSGMLNAGLTLTGKGTELSTLTGTGNLTIRDIKFFDRNIDTITANIEIAQQQLKITSAQLQRNKTIASLTGWIAQDQRLELVAKGNTDDLNPWLPQAKGAAQFQLTWTNTLQKPFLTCYLASTSGGYARISWDKAEAVARLTDKMQGTIEFNGERIILGTQRFDRATATIKLADPIIELTQLTAFQKDGSSQANGKLNLTTGEMSLNVEGKKLDLMSLLFGGTPAPWWESGEVYLRGEFIGNYKQHYATTKIKDLQIVSKQKIVGFPKPALVNEQEILITWQNQRLTIPATKFTDGTGTFAIDGNILLTSDYHLDSYAISLNGNKIIWPVLRGLNALYTPQLSLQGNKTRVNLTGDFRIAQADIDGPIMFAPNIGAQHAAPLPRKTPLTINLMFRAEDKLHLKTPMLDVDGKGWINLAGPANEPQISYEFRSVGGVVMFRGYKFQITKADAKPVASMGFNPLMDLYAQKKIRTTDVYLRFYGTLQDYEITLTSDPPMEQSDIMALLTTGRTTEELRTATGTGSERVAYGLAAGYVGEELLNTVGSPIVKAVGIDRVGVDYETSNEPRVKIEKDLGKRVTVSYSMGVTKYPDPQAKVELGLGRNLSLVGTAGTNSLTQTATGAVDLELKFRTK
ncbi:MAG: translocation/assembly module TamB domain-containing protein [bacterium]|nr:translocation/assembly module TamB domain-containing protein [bacterium]